MFGLGKKDNQKKAKKSKKTKGMKITRPGDLPKDALTPHHIIDVPQGVSSAVMVIDADLADIQKKAAELNNQFQKLNFSKQQLLRSVVLQQGNLPAEEKLTFVMSSDGTSLYLWDKDKLPKPTPVAPPAPEVEAEETAVKK